MGFDAFGSEPDEFAAFVIKQLDAWGSMTKDAGIEPQ